MIQSNVLDKMVAHSFKLYDHFCFLLVHDLLRRGFKKGSAFSKEELIKAAGATVFLGELSYYVHRRECGL